jgi:hypothetical protein
MAAEENEDKKTHKKRIKEEQKARRLQKKALKDEFGYQKEKLKVQLTGKGYDIKPGVSVRKIQ